MKHYRIISSVTGFDAGQVVTEAELDGALGGAARLLSHKAIEEVSGAEVNVLPPSPAEIALASGAVIERIEAAPEPEEQAEAIKPEPRPRRGKRR